MKDDENKIERIARNLIADANEVRVYYLKEYNGIIVAEKIGDNSLPANGETIARIPEDIIDQFSICGSLPNSKNRQIVVTKDKFYHVYTRNVKDQGEVDSIMSHNRRFKLVDKEEDLFK